MNYTKCKKNGRAQSKRADNTLSTYVSQLKKAVAMNNQMAGQRLANELSRVQASRVSRTSTRFGVCS